MYIHIGRRRIISDKKIVGIFNYKTLILSDLNSKFLGNISADVKGIVIDENNFVSYSDISTFTLIKRTNIKEAVWRRENV